MRQQAGIPEYQPAHRRQIVDGGGVAERGQPVAGGLIAPFRLVAQGKQGFGATGLGAGAGDREDFIRAEIGGMALFRALGEAAVVADVSA